MPSACDGVPSAGLAWAHRVLMGWSLSAPQQRKSWHKLPCFAAWLHSCSPPRQRQAVKPPTLGSAAGTGKSSFG